MKRIISLILLTIMIQACIIVINNEKLIAKGKDNKKLKNLIKKLYKKKSKQGNEKDAIKETIKEIAKKEAEESAKEKIKINEGDEKKESKEVSKKDEERIIKAETTKAVNNVIKTTGEVIQENGSKQKIKENMNLLDKVVKDEKKNIISEIIDELKTTKTTVSKLSEKVEEYLNNYRAGNDPEKPTNGGTIDKKAWEIASKTWELEVQDAANQVEESQKVNLEEPLKFNFIVGIEMSTYKPSSTSSITASKAFGTPTVFVGINGESFVSGKKKFFSFLGEIRFSRSNYEQQKATTGTYEIVKDAESIAIDLGFRFKPLQIWKIKQPHIYIKAMSSPKISANSEISKDFVWDFSSVLGFEYFRPSSLLHGSYMEFGFGTNKSFFRPDNKEPEARFLKRFKANGTILLSKTVFLTGKLDMSVKKGSDEFRVLIGVQRDIDFLSDITKKIFGMK